ncbi:GNAT family N-acetyltransferase [Azospirillum sp. ST 5-10]
MRRGFNTETVATFVAFYDGVEVGWASFTIGERSPFATGIEVHPDYRRRQVATHIYDRADRHFEQPCVPSLELTPDSKACWLVRQGSTPADARALPMTPGSGYAIPAGRTPKHEASSRSSTCPSRKGAKIVEAPSGRLSSHRTPPPRRRDTFAPARSALFRAAHPVA